MKYINMRSFNWGKINERREKTGSGKTERFNVSNRKKAKACQCAAAAVVS
jgi:hypothetical protein